LISEGGDSTRLYKGPERINLILHNSTVHSHRKMSLTLYRSKDYILHIFGCGILFTSPVKTVTGNLLIPVRKNLSVKYNTIIQDLDA